MPRHLTAKHLRTLQDLPAAIEALERDLSQALALAQKARAQIEHIGVPHGTRPEPQPAVPPEIPPRPNGLADGTPTPDPQADEAKAAALAVNARRKNRVLTKEEEEQVRFLQFRKAEKDALVAQLRGGEA